MDGYVAKPIKPVELFEVIDRVIAANAVVCLKKIPNPKTQAPNPKRLDLNLGFGPWVWNLGFTS
jgi:hypothetical protein